MQEKEVKAVETAQTPNIPEANFGYLKGSTEEPTHRYFGGQPAQTKKLSKFAKTIIWECAKNKQFDNVVKAWCEVDTFCKKKRYTPEQVGAFLRYCKKKLIHEQLKEKLNSESLKTTNKTYSTVPTYLQTTQKRQKN